MSQIDRLLQESVAQVMQKWECDSCPALKLKVACDANLNFHLPKAIGGLKTTGLDQGELMVCIVFIHHCTPHTLLLG
jgi:hypothetical protein